MDIPLKQIAKDEKGLTLLEMILYLALFAILFVVVIQFTISVAESNQEARARGDVETAIMFSMMHLEDSFEVAESVDSNNSVFYSNNGTITLVTSSGSVEYGLDGGQLMFTTGGESIPLTGSKVSVDRLYVEELLDGGGMLTGARITLEISSIKFRAVNEIETAYSL